MPPSIFPHVSFETIDRDTLNDALVAWNHAMGPVNRPTRGWSHGLCCDGKLLAVVATDTLIRQRVAGLSRRQAIELSRLCAAQPDLCRVALRLWRAFVFPTLCLDRGCRWALSYQDAILHSGNLCRFDGWVRLATSRSGTDPRTGRIGRRRVVWGWCDCAGERRRRGLIAAGSIESSRASPGAGATADREPFTLDIQAFRTSPLL